MNKSILMGRLTSDPEIRNTANGVSVVSFTLAVDRKYKKDGDEQTADFIRCIAFNKTAEFINKYGKKGTKFVIEGHIQTGNYTDKDGKKVYTTDVIVESVEFAESKSSSSNNQSASANKNTDFVNIPNGIEDSEFPFN